MIGVFDSGVGGLSVWRELAAQLSEETIVSFSDQSHVPYGPRPLAEIREFSRGITQFLLDQGCRIIVVACNAASAASLSYLRSAFPHVPFVGMEPAVKPAALHTKTRKIGVMATPATFQGELFANTAQRFAADAHLVKEACPGLVEQIEAGRLDTPDTEALLRKFLGPMQEAAVDTIVLACTHYPFLAPAIQRIAGPQVRVIDPAPAVARQVKRLMHQRNLLNSSTKPQRVFYTTGHLEAFTDILQKLVGATHQMASIRQAQWNDAQRTVIDQHR